MNSSNIQKILLQEAERLKECIQKRLDEFYNSRQPKIYDRSHGLQRALRLDDDVKVSVNGKSLEIEIYFDEESDTGYSLFQKGKTVRKSDIINYGFRTNGRFKDVENFGWRRGALFIEQGIEDFNMDNPYGLKIEIVGKRKAVKR